ncbi:pilus assembly protein [Variovorax sp. HJSM1_2]|uniref:pilus assembly protein n=1 Tax=Variovorax sp. HJSM1_2 TaxID=3366263 RepID=UPI003BD3E82A
MTRLDVVRKMLYGGKRRTDTTTSGTGTTVLERAQLTFDAHAFVKFYRGTDIRDYTPFSTTDLIKTTGANAGVYAGLSICNLGSEDSYTSSSNAPIMRMVKGNVRFWSTVEVRLCQWREDYGLGTFGPKLARYYQDANKGGGSIAHEITIPSRTTDGATYGGIGPELTVRVKVCDPSLLGEERCQAFPSNSVTNYKPYGLFQEFGYSTTGGAARAEFAVITGSYDLNYTAGALRKNMGDFADEINPSTGVFCHSASSGCSSALASPDGRSTGVGAIKAFDAIVLYGRSNGGYGSSGTPSGVAEGSLPAWGNPIGEMLVQALQYYAYNGTTPTPTNPSSTSRDGNVGAPVTAWRDPLSNSNTTRNSLYGNSVCRPLNVLLMSNSALSFDGQAATPFGTLPTGPSITTYTNRVGTAENFDNTLRSVGSVTGGYGTSCSAKTISTLDQVSGICPEAPAMGGTYQVAGAALYGNTNKIRTVTNPPSDLAATKDVLKVKTLAASLTGGAPRIDIPVPGTSRYVYITPESVQNGGAISAPLTFASVSSSATHGAFIVTWNDVLMGGDYDMDITGFIRYDLVDRDGVSNASGPYIKVTTDIPGVCGGAAGTHGFSIIGVTDDTGASKNGRYLTHQHSGSSGTAYATLSGMPASSEYLCGDSTYRNRTIRIGTTDKLFQNTVCAVTGDGSTGDSNIPNLANYCSVKNEDYPVSTTFKMVGETDALLKDPLYYAAKYGDFDSSTKNADGSYTEVSMPSSTDSWDKVKADGSPGADGVPDGYFLARRPDLLEQQLRKALDSLAKNSNSAPASSSRQLTTDGYKYVAKFDSTTISGNVEAYKVDSTGEYKSVPEWRAGQLLRTLANSTAGSTAGAGDSRNIITNYGNRGTGVTAGVPFRWASLPEAYKTQMTDNSTNRLTAANATVVLNYLRGDQSKEAASTGLRERSDNLLGPVINATPWVQSPPAAFYAEALFPGYRSYVDNNKTRSKLLWVSANDGMLHAFNATSGAEVLAYVPGPLANRLAEIPMQRGSVGRTRLDGANFTRDSSETLPDGNVWAYVDGSPFTADVQLPGSGSTQGAWKTYAFSSLGRGGKAFFALDVTTASAVASAEAGTNPNDIFRWQFTSDDDNDLGYNVNDVSINVNSGQANPIVKLNNGRFAVLLNNGYKSTNGKAVLYLLYVDGPNASGTWVSGTNFVKIVADVGTGNGLSPPTWIDLDNNGTADVVYAGDLKGNMWKFDLSSTDSTNWAVAYKSGGANLPLFKARAGDAGTGDGLPITTAPEFAYPAFDGLIITFATGNAFETGDFPKASVTQRMYGIWDRPGFGTGTGGRTLPTSLSTLVSRSYQRLSSGLVVLTGTNDAIDWLNKDGWYFNLPGSSEMVLSDPDLSAGVLTFTAVRPKTDQNNCNNTPDVTLYTIDPISGKSERNSQGETTVGSSKILVSGTSISDQKVVVVNDRTSKPYTRQSCAAGSAGCTCTTSNGVTTCTKDTPACADDQYAKKVVGESTGVTLCYNPNSRVQWREIPGLRTY